MEDLFENLDLERLRLRRSEKWSTHPPDVLPAFVAEMDFPLAEPVRRALIGAIELDDCGYATAGGLGDALAEFGPQGSGFVRLNFGTSSALLTEAVRRMARAL